LRCAFSSTTTEAIMKAVLLLSMAAVVLAAGSDDDDSSAVAAGSDSSDSKASCPPSPPPMREGVVCGKEDSMDYFATSNLWASPPSANRGAGKNKGTSSTGSTAYSEVGTDLNIDCVSWCQSKATELNKQLFAAETYMYYRAYGNHGPSASKCPANEGDNCGDVCYCYEESGCPFVCDIDATGTQGGDNGVYFYSGTTFLAAGSSVPRGDNNECSDD